MLGLEATVRSWSVISRALSQFAPARAPHARRRLTLERLEGRSLLSTVHLTVNTLADDPGGPVAGQMTLRDAITAADAGPVTNKYIIKFSVDGAIALSAHLPILNGKIVIRGPGAANLGIYNQFSSLYDWPLLEVQSASPVVITGLSFNYGFNDFGGDIENVSSPMTTVKDCTFYGSTAAFGGAISTNSDMTIVHCTFANNRANWGGGAIFTGNSDETVKIIDSTFTNNAADIPNPGDGGAIYNQGETLIIKGDTFTSNGAVNGGAIYNAIGGTMTLTTSTFSGNGASVGVDIFNAGTANIGKKIIAALGDDIYNVGTLN